MPTPEPVLVRGARTVANRAKAAAERARFAQPALVNGTVGLVATTSGRLSQALAFTYADGKITEIDIIAEPERLRTLDIGVLDAADT